MRSKFLTVAFQTLAGEAAALGSGTLVGRDQLEKKKKPTLLGINISMGNQF